MNISILNRFLLRPLVRCMLMYALIFKVLFSYFKLEISMKCGTSVFLIRVKGILLF